MKDATQRAIFRCIHLIFGIPIIGYIYSPFKELPTYAPTVRYVALPIILFSEFWLWKRPLIMRLISKKSA